MNETTNNTTPNSDIMHYESDIWAVADLLLAAGIKQSDFPKFMMPFFALVMLEGRMLNAVKKVEEEEGITAKDNPEDFNEAFLEKDCGYNEYIVMQGKTLDSISKNDKTFNQDFKEYLNKFDNSLKELLGIDREKSQDKFLDLDGIVAELSNKKILMSIVQTWAKINLSPYDNSEITTLEEHIKRKWADISASTAGEQYTPDDIISLIAEIVAAKVNKPKNEYIHIYDPSCGGANLLYGVADRLEKEAGYHNIATYGSEYNGSLCALASIESRFREKSTIHYGNTLTTVPFKGKDFDIIVANPPYGTKWIGYEKEVKKDECGQFPAGYQTTQDGQLLFMQHILWQLADNGIAVEVHSGSSLFSGDAGSGESNIRKYMFDHDWVEAIIQLPQQEFFNTGIYTYLWIMNKKKDPLRKNKVILIDGSKGWAPLKKSKGDKRREMTADDRKYIVDALVNFTDTPISKVFDKEHFYYNKQSLILTEKSDNKKTVCDSVCKDGKPYLIKDAAILTIGEESYKNFTDMAGTKLRTLGKKLMESNQKCNIAVTTLNNEIYKLNINSQSIYFIDKNECSKELGCGDIALKATISNNVVKSVKIQIIPRKTSDYEIIPFSSMPEQNKRNIDDFMTKYILKPYELGKDSIGVEINFNKEFYVPIILPRIEEIKEEIKKINDSLLELEDMV